MMFAKSLDLASICSIFITFESSFRVCYGCLYDCFLWDDIVALIVFMFIGVLRSGKVKEFRGLLPEVFSWLLIKVMLLMVLLMPVPIRGFQVVLADAVLCIFRFSFLLFATLAV